MKRLEKTLLTLQEFGTYRMNKGALLVKNPQTSVRVRVQSFNLDNVPKLDAAILIGGYPRPVVEAAEALIIHKSVYGEYPELFCIGYKSPRGQVRNSDFTTFFKLSEEVMYEQLFIALGFSPTWVLKNHWGSQSVDTNGNIAEIRARLSAQFPGQRVRVGVFTEAGYSLRLAQELCFALPEYEFIFFEPTITPLKQRKFWVEILHGGYWADITAASVFHAINRQSWGVERLPLPSVYHSQFKRLRRAITQVAYAGYVFYLYKNNLQSLGFGERWIEEVKAHRQIEVIGLSPDEGQIGQMMKSLNPIIKDRIAKDMVEKTKKDWAKRGIKPL